MEHCPTTEQIADMWPKQPGPGHFLVIGGCFLGLDRFLCPFVPKVGVLIGP